MVGIFVNGSKGTVFFKVAKAGATLASLALLGNFS